MEHNWTNYLGIKHDYSKINCITIIELVYRQELNILLRENISLVGTSIRDLLSVDPLTFFTLRDWFPLRSLKELNPYDVLIFRDKKGRAKHFGLFVGNNRFLHLPEKSISQIDELNEDYRQSILVCLRHQQLDTSIPK